MDQAEAVLDDETQVTDAAEVEEAAEQQEESAAAEAATESTEGADDDGEIVVSIAGESPTPEDETPPGGNTAWIKELRQRQRDLIRKQRELEAENARLRGAKAEPAAAVVVGARPTLEACDYDADAFAEKLEQWHERKRQADEQAAKVREAEQSAAKAWQSKVQGYEQARASLGEKIKGAAEAEEVARESFSVVQQGILLQGLPAQEAATMMVALGKSPTRLQKLAAISDPVQFAVAVGELKRDIQMTPTRKQAPAPEKVVRAAGALPTVGAAALEKLKAEAAKSGNYDKYFEAKRKLKG